MADVQFNKITKRFGDITAVLDFSLSIEEGEFITLLGPSGCGKTTTLRLLAGFYPPSSGSIEIGGEPASDLERNVFLPPGRRRLGMVFQDYALWPHMTVSDNVRYPLKIAGRPRTEQNAKVDEILAIVEMSGCEQRFPHELSGGQQQRIALARALISDPRVLLLDEPLSNLDASLRENMRVEIKNIHRRLGVSILLVTHDQAEAMSMSDRIVVMDHGCIHQIGTPEELYDSPVDEFVASFVGKANFFKVRQVGTMLYLCGDSRSDGAFADEEFLQPLESAHIQGSPVRGLGCAKPTDFQISRDAPTGAHGIIESSLFIGDSVVYYVRVGSIQFQVKTEDRSFEIGTDVSVSFKKVILF